MRLTMEGWVSTHPSIALKGRGYTRQALRPMGGTPGVCSPGTLAPIV